MQIMSRTLVIAAILSFVAFAVLFGCQTTQPQPGIARADILRTLDGGELAVSIALGFAQTRGADVAQLSKDVELAFDIARDVVAVDVGDMSPAALRSALDGVKVVVADVIRVCHRAGVSEARIELLEVSLEGVYSVIEDAIAGMEDRGMMISLVAFAAGFIVGRVVMLVVLSMVA